MGVICAACTKGSSTLSYNGEITENMPETSDIGDETSKEQNVKTEPSTEAQSETQTEVPKETQTEVPQETVVKYELNTVESLEDDGKDMSAAEAIRSAMKGKRSALELTREERFFFLRDGDEPYYAKEIKDMPADGLRRIDLHRYNRGAWGISPIWTETWDKWEKFICVDLDQDGTKEVVLDGDSINVFLHYKDGEVYLTEPTPRLFPYEVYENGICLSEGGAFSTGYNRLYPAKGAMYVESVAYFTDNSDIGFDSNYEIMGRAVTKEEYEAYIEQLIGGSIPLEWHEFTEENIDRYVAD